jgi:para-aminobenzoate synthetase component I
MDKLTIEELPYPSDSSTLFTQFHDLELPVYLDSSAPYSMRGRYDILTAQPEKLLINPTQSDSYNTNSNYFITLGEAIDEVTPRLANDYHLPFIGGAIGYFSYDLGRELEQLPAIAKHDIQLPCAISGVYTWAIIVDHRQQRATLIAHPRCRPDLLAEIKARVRSSEQVTLPPFQLNSEFRSNMSHQQYSNAFQVIKDYILKGDCYQVNLAQRFSATFSGAPWEAYLRLRQTAAAPFSAYMAYKDYALLSVSPERFLHVSNEQVTTSPIKGTIARGNTPEHDRALAHELLNSAKDRAENLMIVDLLRNDLGKACQPGSIHVNELFELQTFETVHHLVSTITGRLRPEQQALDLLQKSFPGGSITGAPKIRAMEIIEELEPCRRSAYCGSIGYISCDGQMDTNIAIRTMVCENNRIHCWGGGGIVADSTCASEYQESLTKVEKLLNSLQTT